MEVKCTSLTNADGMETSKRITLGALYEFICLTFDAYTKTVYARLIGDKATIPAVYPLDRFEIVEGTMPTTWQIFGGKNGGLFIGPASRAQPGFWEKFFERDATAREVFETELRRIHSAI